MSGLLDGYEDLSRGKLRDKFSEPPFSVLDTKGKEWQLRRRKWLDLGIKSELGRDVTVLKNTFGDKYGRSKKMPEASIFDPSLTELMYTWFCPEGGYILDPFAGGSVRGIVAHYLGYNYNGIELRKEQIDSNIEQARKILGVGNMPNWINGDSDVELEYFVDVQSKTGDKKIEVIDFVFSCPPYVDLEVYSDDSRDLSNMNYSDFLIKYGRIINNCIKLLRKDHYACFVVAEVRDKKGYCYNFVADTKKLFESAGAKLYNDAVLLNAYGTAMLRAGGFNKSKKLVRVHQNVLIFKKI